MKTFIIIMLLATPTYAQNFMMDMEVREERADTSIVYSSIKVIWGMKHDKICFLWEDYPKCFEKMKNPSFNTPKAARKKLDETIKLLEKERKDRDRNIRLREIYHNPYGEIFLITILINDGLIIFIVRLDDVHPNYSFRMLK